VKTLDGRLVILGGASRSGKTAYARKLAGNASPAFCFDIEDQWGKLPGWTRHTAAAAWAAAVLANKGGRHALVPSGKLADLFAYFCAVVFAFADRHGRCTVIAEELADVTTPGKAPAKWGALLRRGLKRGVTIYAISQRWAEADKTALGNASEFVIFRQSSADDVKYLARKTRVPAAEIDQLKPLEYVKYDAMTQTHKAGKLSFRT
jgi:hypothetical protein